MRLLNRTSRSVTLTAAGEELRTAILTPFAEIGRAMDVLNRFRDAPIGRIRLSVPTEAADFIVGPILPVSLERYPDVEIEISVSNRMIDMVDRGFDAGIRYGGTVPENMIAQRLAPDFRWVVVAAPAYLERFGTPLHPSDLRHHRGVRIRIGDESIYRWEFERGEEKIQMEVPGSLLVDQGHVAFPAVKRGSALMCVPDFLVSQSVRDSALTTVLDDYITPAGGNCRRAYDCPLGWFANCSHSADDAASARAASARRPIRAQSITSIESGADDRRGAASPVRQLPTAAAGAELGQVATVRLINHAF